MKNNNENSSNGMSAKNQIVIMAISSLGFAVAMAWNELIKAFFTKRYGEKTEPRAHLIYAIFVSILAIVATYYIVKYANKLSAAEQEKEEDDIIY